MKKKVAAFIRIILSYYSSKNNHNFNKRNNFINNINNCYINTTAVIKLQQQQKNNNSDCNSNNFKLNIIRSNINIVNNSSNTTTWSLRKDESVRKWRIVNIALCYGTNKLSDKQYRTYELRLPYFHKGQSYERTDGRINKIINTYIHT